MSTEDLDPVDVTPCESVRVRIEPKWGCFSAGFLFGFVVGLVLALWWWLPQLMGARSSIVGEDLGTLPLSSFKALWVQDRPAIVLKLTDSDADRRLDALLDLLNGLQSDSTTNFEPSSDDGLIAIPIRLDPREYIVQFSIVTEQELLHRPFVRILCRAVLIPPGGNSTSAMNAAYQAEIELRERLHTAIDNLNLEGRIDVLDVAPTTAPKT